MARQLQRLSFYGSLLYACRPPEEGTDAFAAPQWEQLQELDLELASINAPILGVDMPVLEDLRLGNLPVRGHDDALHDTAEAFAAGCPQCSSLLFQPAMQHAPIHMFTALKTLQLALDPASRDDTIVQVPTTLTALDCRSASARHIENLTNAQHLQLHAVLSVAAACIQAGAPLPTLRAAHCLTSPVYDGYDNFMPVVHVMPLMHEELLHTYDPLWASLHGLAILDLAASPECSARAVREVVSASPDLRSLVISVDAFNHMHVHRRTIACSGLTDLKVDLDIWIDQPDEEPDDIWGDQPNREPVELDLVLEDYHNLGSCKVKVVIHKGDLAEGDTVFVWLRRHACVRASVDQDDGGRWCLGVDFCCPEGAEGTMGSRVCFVYDDFTWKVHVCSDV